MCNVYYNSIKRKNHQHLTSLFPHLSITHCFCTTEEAIKSQAIKNSVVLEEGVSLKLQSSANFIFYHEASGHLLSNSSASLREKERELLAILHYLATNNKLEIRSLFLAEQQQHFVINFSGSSMEDNFRYRKQRLCADNINHGIQYSYIMTERQEQCYKFIHVKINTLVKCR